VEAAAVPEGAPAEPDAPEAGVVIVDVPGPEITSDGTPIFAPIVGVTPITLLPMPVDPVVGVLPAATVVVDPARVVVPEVAGESAPEPVPMAAVPAGDVDDSVDDVGDTIVVAGIDVTVVGTVVAGVAVEVEAPALFPAPA